MKECIRCKESTFDEKKEVCLNCGSSMNLWSEVFEMWKLRE
jgi:ribosomal protein L37E